MHRIPQLHCLLFFKAHVLLRSDNALRVDEFIGRVIASVTCSVLEKLIPLGNLENQNFFFNVRIPFTIISYVHECILKKIYFKYYSSKLMDIKKKIFET